MKWQIGKMKKIKIIVVVLVLITRTYAVTVKTTANLNVYYPEYSRIDLVCDRHFTTGGSLLDSLNK